jgi:hypothetical protein
MCSIRLFNTFLFVNAKFIGIVHPAHTGALSG